MLLEKTKREKKDECIVGMGAVLPNSVGVRPCDVGFLLTRSVCLCVRECECVCVRVYSVFQRRERGLRSSFS